MLNNTINKTVDILFGLTQKIVDLKFKADQNSLLDAQYQELNNRIKKLMNGFNNYEQTDLLISGSRNENINGIYKLIQGNADDFTGVWKHEKNQYYIYYQPYGTTDSSLGPFVLWTDLTFNGSPWLALHYGDTTSKVVISQWTPQTNNNYYPGSGLEQFNDNKITVQWAIEKDTGSDAVTDIDINKVVSFRVQSLPEAVIDYVNDSGLVNGSLGTYTLDDSTAVGTDRVWSANRASLYYAPLNTWWCLVINGPGVVLTTTDENPFTSTNWQLNVSPFGKADFKFVDIEQQ